MQFMVLLVLRHALPVLLSGTREYSLPLLMVSRRKRAQTLLALQQRDSRLMYDFFARQLLSLRTVGIVLPIYIIIRVLTAIQRHRRQNVQVQGTSLMLLIFPKLDTLRFVSLPHHERLTIGDRIVMMLLISGATHRCLRARRSLHQTRRPRTLPSSLLPYRATRRQMKKEARP